MKPDLGEGQRLLDAMLIKECRTRLLHGAIETDPEWKVRCSLRFAGACDLVAAFHSRGAEALEGVAVGVRKLHAAYRARLRDLGHIRYPGGFGP